MGYSFNKVEICGVNTSELPVLKEAEKTELLKKTKAGDKNARQKLISGNLKLVLSVIQRFANRDCPDDLFQVGCIGLIKAIDNFDITLDVRFSTYAVPTIYEGREFIVFNQFLMIGTDFYLVLRYLPNFKLTSTSPFL